MSISLNDHENRIRVLENAAEKLKFTTVYNNSTGIKLSNDCLLSDPSTWITITEFDPTASFYLIETCTETNTVGDGISVFSQQKIISTFGLSYNSATKKSGKFVEIYVHSDSDGKIELCYIGVHDNKLKAFSADTFGGTGNWLRKVAILKLYYSFSYNIIYRATHFLEKIFYVLNKGGVSL